MSEGQIETGINRSQNNIINLATERQKRVDAKSKAGAPVGEIQGNQADTLLAQTLPQERASGSTGQ
jgi:hypothetical protein